MPKITFYKWLKSEHYFALATSSLLWLIYTINRPKEAVNSIFIPWDGYVNKNNLSSIDLNSETLRAFSGVHSMPDYIWHTVISNMIGAGAYIARIIPIIFACYLVSLYIYKKLIKKTSLTNILISLILIILLFSNITFQWLVNDGVMYGVTVQACMLLGCLTILFGLSDLNHTSDTKIMTWLALIVANALLSLWSFAFLIPQCMLIILCFAQLYKRRCELLNLKYIKVFLSINILLFATLAALFYLIVSYDHYSLFNTLIPNANRLIDTKVYENISGGILNQLAGLNDYSMYTNLGNLSFGSMNFNFDLFLPQFCILALYICIISYALLYKLPNFLYQILLFIAIGLFFSKASQIPFGFIYEFLVRNFTIFQSIRTPDTKFGIYIISFLILLCLFCINTYKSKILKALVASISLIYLSCTIYPILESETTFGRVDQNTGNHPYSVDLDTDLKLITLLQDLSLKNKKGVLIPGIGHIQTNFSRIGFQDYLDKVVPNLLSYNSSYDGPHNQYLRAENNAYTDNNFVKWLNLRKISYLIIRKSYLTNRLNICLACIEKNEEFSKIYDDNFSVVFLYKKDHLIESNYPSMSVVNKVIFLQHLIFIISALILIGTIAYFLFLKSVRPESVLESNSGTAKPAP